MIIKASLGTISFILLFMLTFFFSNNYFEQKFYYQNLDTLLHYEDELDTNLRDDYITLIRKLETTDRHDIEEAGGICNLPLSD